MEARKKRFKPRIDCKGSKKIFISVLFNKVAFLFLELLMSCILSAFSGKFIFIPLLPS